MDHRFQDNSVIKHKIINGKNVFSLFFPRSLDTQRLNMTQKISPENNATETLRIKMLSTKKKERIKYIPVFLFIKFLSIRKEQIKTIKLVKR